MTDPTPDLESIRKRLEAAPTIIPHMPQDGGAALCDLDDKDLGRLYPGPQMEALARFLGHAGPDIAFLLGDVARLRILGPDTEARAIASDLLAPVIDVRNETHRRLRHRRSRLDRVPRLPRAPDRPMPQL